MDQFSDYGGVLGRGKILKAIKENQILIHPFNEENLQTTSYDVCLGPNYYRKKVLPFEIRHFQKIFGTCATFIVLLMFVGIYFPTTTMISFPLTAASFGVCIYFVSPQSKILHAQMDHYIQPNHPRVADKLWESSSQSAMTFKKWKKLQWKNNLGLSISSSLFTDYCTEEYTFKDTDLVIELHPGETILGHTIEFIGSKCSTITTMMKTKSSYGRVCVTTCSCAGWGDPGYHWIWTMEIKNQGQPGVDPILLLPVGKPIAQIIFLPVSTLEGEVLDYAKAGGSYQKNSHTTLEDLQKSWKPEMMLPKPRKHVEIVKGEISTNSNKQE